MPSSYARATRSTGSTPARCGTRSAASCRRSNGPGWTRATSTWARWPRTTFWKRASSPRRSERDPGDREQLHGELRRMAERVGEHLRTSGRTARTVTTKLRYTDFSIRSRSTSLRVGIDDAAEIGELACTLLDRALRERPGALRLVGVGVSGLSDFRQLAFPALCDAAPEHPPNEGAHGAGSAVDSRAGSAPRLARS